MNDDLNSDQIKVCCADFYQSDIIKLLLGDIMHPGGLELTHHLGQTLGLSKNKRVLDVACGRGSSAIHLAESFGCQVTGLDYGTENIANAKANAKSKEVSAPTSFKLGDAELLPIDDGTFDAVISECSFCIFPDKVKAATEIARVLRPQGKYGMTDITINEPLPEDMQSLLTWVSCVAGAGAPEQYVSTLKQAGFGNFVVQDHSNVLLTLVNDIRKKLLGVELIAGLGKLDMEDFDLNKAKRLTKRGIELIEKGVVGYTLITAIKL
ncbi:MAG: class I SAM-dependent methyltransferase [Chloroflexi bacterium]|jgi:arsenite methyltransferase|nr:class I SAM-dependent methyltransferase [Chloroflexota bacterium]MBT7080456.1 class I SAM-dependent methyltransferase [Chloroflexota bacterium]MBT7289159.1 class I SAM-dependent methyltransferase [Chloroflexota bacterium]